MRAFGHQYTEFALPVFSDAAMSRWRLLPIRPPVVMPLGLVAPDGRTMLLAPLDWFHEQVIGVPAGKEQAGSGLRAGWHGDIDEVAAGFATELAVIAGDGARDCFARWARLLRRFVGRGGAAAGRRRARHARVVLDRQRQRVLVPDRARARRGVDGRRRGRRPRGARRARRRGATRLVVVSARGAAPVRHRRVGRAADAAWSGGSRAPTCFPTASGTLRERLGRRPLVAHCRHLSSQSPYLDEFAMWVDGDRAHPQDGELYERLLDQAVAWGVEVFEHDWLDRVLPRRARLRARRAAPRRGRRASTPGSARANLHAQWCMASPADFAQTSRLRQRHVDPHERRPRVPGRARSCCGRGSCTPT